MALTPAMEDYLEAILMIKQQHGYVRCVDVAEQLGVKKPSVSRAVKELTKSGHLVKNADGTLSHRNRIAACRTDLRKAPVFHRKAYCSGCRPPNSRTRRLQY